MKTDRRPDPFVYHFTQFLAWFLATFIFGRRILRNEIRHQKGPFVVIANHECALDFVNLIGLRWRPMRFVVSHFAFNTLPVRGLAARLAPIIKQQFQTKPGDLKKMKQTLQDGIPLVIYPAGLMCEDGLSTPIPSATYRFLKWLDVDVYVARSTGSFFVQPKWTKGLRPGRTLMDVYKLMDRQELSAMDETAIKEKVDGALLFDAYREEEANHLHTRYNSQIGGLHYVLYQCPHCLTEGAMETEGDQIRCRACGFEEASDDTARLHKTAGPGEEICYVSDWSTRIRELTREQLLDHRLTKLEGHTTIQLLDLKKKKFQDAGTGLLHLNAEEFHFTGELNNQPADLHISIRMMPTLPFRPGHHIELQQGDTIYRCVMDDPTLLMKFVNMVELFYEIHHA